MSLQGLLRQKDRRVSTIRSTDRVDAAVAQLHKERIGCLVVLDRWGKLAGMLSERDVIRGLAQDGAKALDYQVHELMSPDVTTCGPADRIDRVMSMMTVHRIRHVPVMENGRILGIVSIGDLVKYRLEEKAIEADVLLDIARAHV
jgi:CBS domain-containing protein